MATFSGSSMAANAPQRSLNSTIGLLLNRNRDVPIIKTAEAVALVGLPFAEIG